MSEKGSLLPTKCIFAANTPSKGAQMRSNTRPFAQGNLISRIAAFQIIGKARKQGEAIWIKCVVCSYFHKFLHFILKIDKVIIHLGVC